MTTLIGLDVGGTRIKAVAFKSAGTKLGEESVATKDDGTRAWLQRARGVVRKLQERFEWNANIGVAAPGMAAADRSRIAFLPGRLSGLEGLNWRDWLQSDTDVPVFNDAQAALLGEIWQGAAKGSKNVVLLTLGTGVGGAAMVDGHLLHGQIGRAGHLGHVSLDPDGALDIAQTPGSLEDAIGECKLAVRSRGQFSTTRDLVEAFRNGSKDAAEVWLRSVKCLAAACAGFINVLDPELIVLGGGIADADESLSGPLRSELDKFEWRPGGARVRVVKAALGKNAGATGAAYGVKIRNDE